MAEMTKRKRESSTIDKVLTNSQNRAAGLKGAGLRSSFGPASNQINRRFESRNGTTIFGNGIWQLSKCPAESAVGNVALATLPTGEYSTFRRNTHVGQSFLLILCENRKESIPMDMIRKGARGHYV